MFARSLTVLALLAQYTVAQITGTYSSILLTATGTPTFTVPVEQETNFPNCTVNCIEIAGELSICPNPLAPDCVCKAPFRAAVASCLSLTCTDAEYLTLFTIVESLCVPVGGISPGIPSACRASSGNGTGCGTGTGSPKPSATAHVSRRSNRLGSFGDSVAKK
ncbi:MAG: hypothetical protein Q9214_001359 [Letrouitia sp. 1 TL-2023]